MSRRTTRRTFMRQVGLAGAALPVVTADLLSAPSANSKLNLTSVGVGGKGWEDLIGSSGGGKLHNVVAICDVDHRVGAKHPDNLAPAQLRRPVGIGTAAEKFPRAKVYRDWRRLLEQNDIDAVTVSTPDHMHAPISIAAMQLGKHVYCQKPLTYNVYEARQMRLVAQRCGVTTQMGNQFHSGIGYRCLVQVIRSGAIGKIRAAHAWTKSPSWPQGIGRPAGSDPLPKGLHWDLWLGVAPPRPYKYNVYTPFNWRGWLDFGTGALGDMGCHVLDPVVWSLELGPPQTITSLGPAPNDQTYPLWTTVRYEFPATPYTAGPTLPVTWYDGGKQPPLELARMGEGRKLPSSGSLYIGEKGVIVISHSFSAPRLYPEDDFKDYSRTTLRELYKSFESLDHYRVWTDACLAGKPANSNFDYAGPLAETVLLGNIALRYPNQPLAWDAAALRFTNLDEANRHVRRAYRKGWEIKGLA